MKNIAKEIDRLFYFRYPDPMLRHRLRNETGPFEPIDDACRNACSVMKTYETAINMTIRKDGDGIKKLYDIKALWWFVRGLPEVGIFASTKEYEEQNP